MPGQVCIRVQRVLVHAPIYDRLVDKFVAASAALKCGDPMDPATVVGPMIDPAPATGWRAGLTKRSKPERRSCFAGSGPVRCCRRPILTNVPARRQGLLPRSVRSGDRGREVLDNWEEAIEQVNDSDFGLQAGVFTHDVNRIFQAFNALEVGGVIVNDFPTLRVDNFPYGGVKDSGFGREGVRYAMEDMSEARMLVVNLNK